MKKSLILVLILPIFLTTGSCKRKNPVDINISCQRLSNCYNTNRTAVTSSRLISLIQSSVSSGDELRCTDATNQLSTFINQDCPF